jgi:hypothetical protein
MERKEEKNEYTNVVTIFLYSSARFMYAVLLHKQMKQVYCGDLMSHGTQH